MADPVFDLERLTPEDLAACGRALASMGEGSPHRQAVAERVVSYLHDAFRMPLTGERSCVLVRCFQTCPYARLPLQYQYAADELLDLTLSSRDVRCLALLATQGAKLVWNDVATSLHHQSIPLPSVEVVRRAPMVARLIEQFGLPLELVAAPPSSPGFLIEGTAGSFDVFHVERALASPFIPAQQEFVEPYGVQSVLGMGGLLSDGELFVVLLFTRVPVSHEVAQHFRTLPLSIRTALLSFGADRTFEKPRS